MAMLCYLKLFLETVLSGYMCGTVLSSWGAMLIADMQDYRFNQAHFCYMYVVQ